MLKFHPGQVVHLIDHDGKQLFVLSVQVEKAHTFLDASTHYELRGIVGTWLECDLFATFENAVAELRKQTLNLS